MLDFNVHDKVSNDIFVPPLRMTANPRMVTWKDQEIILTDELFKILRGLVVSFRPLRWREIYELTHDPETSTYSDLQKLHCTVRSSIKRIRLRFREVDPTFDHIEAMSKLGYRWKRPDNIYILDETPPLKSHDLHISYDQGRAYWKGKDLKLTQLELRILEKLVLSEESVPPEDLYALVYGNNFICGRNGVGYKINTRSLIKRIREKFKIIDKGFNSIITTSIEGYYWDPR